MLHTASDTIIVTGSHTAPGPRAHAYERGETETLCGRPLTQLHWERFLLWPFRATSHALRCDQCRETADEKWVKPPDKQVRGAPEDEVPSLD